MNHFTTETEELKTISSFAESILKTWPISILKSSWSYNASLRKMTKSEASSTEDRTFRDAEVECNKLPHFWAAQQPSPPQSPGLHSKVVIRQTSDDYSNFISLYFNFHILLYFESSRNLLIRKSVFWRLLSFFHQKILSQENNIQESLIKLWKEL